MEARDLNDALDESTGKRLGPTITPRQERWIVAAVLAAFVALATGFSLGPILEGQDEILHYRFVRLLAGTWQLPDRMIIHSEFQQAPLYYALAALIKMSIADPDFDEIVARTNPGGVFTAVLLLPNWQSRPSNDGSTYLVHSRTEDFPYQSGTARAVHMVRLLSIVLGIGTVITCYGIFRMLWPEGPDRRLLGLGIVAFWPLFDYLSGYITNDTLVIFFSSLVLYLTLRQIRDGPSLRWAVVLGVALGGALLSKASALVLAIPVGLAIFLDWRRARCSGLVVLAITLVVSGWWYIRTAIVYGDPTALFVHYWNVPGSYIPPGTIGIWEGLALMGHIYTRLWARFGWMNNVVVSPPIYIFFDFLTLAGVIGAIASGIRWFRQIPNKPVDPIRLRMVAVTAMMGLVTLSAVYFFSTTHHLGATTARHVLLAISVWSSLLAYGLDSWIPQRLKIPFVLIVMAFLFAVATTCLLKYFLPAYRPLSLPSKIEIPLAIRYEDAAELIGVGASTVRAHPGEIIIVTLYWRAIQPTEHDLLISIFSKDSNLLSLMHTPATGNLRSTEWQPGQTWTEHWRAYIPPDTPPQTVFSLGVALLDLTERRSLVPIDASGQTAYPVIIQVVVDAP